MKILSDNGTEFKNQFFMDVATQLGVEHRVYSPPYHPQSNRRIKESAKETVISFRVILVFGDTFLIVEILGNSSNTQYHYSWPSGSGS